MPAPLIVPASTEGDGISLAAYRVDLADQLGTHQSYVVSRAATSGDAARAVVIDDARDDEAERDRWGGSWLYVRDGLEAGSQRRLLSTGYEGPQGAFLVSRPFSAPLAVGTTVELTSPLPVKRHLGTKGLDDLVNEGLERCRIRARVAFTGNDTLRYGLGALPWLTSADQIEGIYDLGGLSASADNPSLSSYRYDLTRVGGALTLEVGRLYAATETFYLGVFVRGDHLIRQDGVWGYGSGGLVSDSDEAAVPLHWARAFGMAKALQHLTRLTMTDRALTDAERQLRLGDLLRERVRWSRAAALIRLEEFPRPVGASPAPLVSAMRSGIREVPVWPEEEGYRA